MAIPDYSHVGAAVQRIKKHTNLPVAVGFGVRTAANAASIAQYADAVVVGTALIDAMKYTLDVANHATLKTTQVVSSLVAELASGVRQAKR